MATGTILPKVKVKEEAKEGRGYRQPPSTPASPSTSNSSVGSGSGGSSSSSGGESSGAASATTSVAASASSSPTARGVPPQQASGVGGRPAIAPPPSVQPAADPVPVDLEPKSKANASVPAGRESAPRDDARPDSPGRRADTDSPAAAPCPAAKPEPEEPEDGAASLSAAAIAGVFAGHGELKSVLGTVVKFATAISPDTGDTVLTLVLALLSGAMTAEEFHSALQEATNYTLKGFVLPHLKQQLPSLQRDLSGAARASSQSCAQFLRSNEAAVLEAVGLLSTAPSDSIELFGERAGGGGGGGGGNQAPAPYAARSASNPSSTATAGLHRFSAGPSSAPKRRPSDTPYYENGAVLSDDVPVYGKRLSSPWSQHHPSQQQQQPSTESGSPYCWYHPVPSASGSIQGHGHRPAPMAAGSVQMNQSSPFAGSHHAAQQQHGHGQPPPSASLDDEWKNIHMMLNCILGMVEKTKKALAILQSRGGLGAAATATVPVSPLQPPSGLPAQNGAAVQAESSSGGDREGSLKRLSGEIVAQTIRAIEDKVAEAKRKDEEAVKRAVMAEVQRAVRVAVAESRASERLRIHRLLDVSLPRRSSAPVRQGTGAAYLRGHGNPPASLDATARPTAAASTSEDEKDSHPRIVSGSSCWNCGRPALETCGGCGIARYCGSFCQHRDWESGGHHATCGSPGSRELRRSASRSPPRVASASASDASVAPIPAALATKGK